MELAEGDGLVLDGGATITVEKKSGGKTRITVDPQPQTKIIRTRAKIGKPTEPPESQ